MAVIVCIGFGSYFLSGSKAQIRINNQIESPNGLGEDIDETAVPGTTQVLSKPKKYRSLKLNISAFENFLADAPLEFSAQAADKSLILSLPLPDGNMGRFRILESPMMSEELARQFPNIKNYSGQGIDDTTATMRFNWTSDGLNAFVISSKGSFMIVPYGRNDREHYMSYFTRDAGGKGFECLTEAAEKIVPAHSPNAPVNSFTGGTLRQYRLITSSTAQFYAFSGSTTQGAINTMNTLISSINTIYEREATIRFIFHGWYVDPQGTVFPVQNTAQMAEINQSLLDSFFGNGNYDVGHVLGFNTSPSGQVNAFSAVCNSPVKAKGATIVSPDLFQSTVVFAHEMGHLLNARHTFTPVSGSCAPASDPFGRVEPGSGSTIMGYAGICAPENLQNFNDNYFHFTSLLRIVDHVDNVFPACGVRTSTGNSPPIISGATGVGATIPANTPFMLTAFASDPNGDAVAFDWEQIDSGNGLPIFRSYFPSTSSTRTFPSLPYILNNGNVPPATVNGFLTGEVLPNTTRTLNFAVSARDNRSTGGTSAGSLQVFVRGDAGPFAVTQPNSNVVWNGGSQQTVNWNVANTNLSPINTSAVRILLSTDGGQTFPTILVDNTPNDGSQVVTIPNIQTSAARIKIEAVNNIYFDVSNTNFTINLTQGCTYSLNPTSRSFTAVSNSSTVDVSTQTNCAWTAQSSAAWLTTGSTGNGSGTVSYAISQNTSTATRTATITVGSQIHTVTQAGAVVPGTRRAFDYDGDGKADVSVFRPSSGSWYISNSSNNSFTGVAFGISTDLTAPADFDGDGKTDLGIFRPSNGTWYLQRSTSGFTAQTFGINGDIPTPNAFVR